MTEPLQIAMVVSIAPTLVGLGTLLASLRNTRKVEAIYIAINSRFDEWRTLIKSSSFAEGAKSASDAYINAQVTSLKKMREDFRDHADKDTEVQGATLTGIEVLKDRKVGS